MKPDRDASVGMTTWLYRDRRARHRAWVVQWLGGRMRRSEFWRFADVDAAEDAIDVLHSGDLLSIARLRAQQRPRPRPPVRVTLAEGASR